MKTSKKYVKELMKQFNYFATWLPGTPLALGDIGIFKNNQFTKIANLSDFEIEFDVEPDESKSTIEHSSKGAVSITAKASGTVASEGSALGDIDAGITVEFSKEDAIFFKANNSTSPSIKNQITLGQQILTLFKEGKWDKDWAVITEIVNAESGTILISSSSDSKIELKASGEIGAGKLDIADAELGLTVTFSKDLSTNIVAEQSLTPLFKASKVKGQIFGPPIFGINKISSMDFITPAKAKQDESLIKFEPVEFEDDDEDDEPLFMG